MEARIERSVELRAPVARVWRALTDHREFGTWFRVQLEGPFVLGEVTRGAITYPGCEHMRFEARIERMEPERLFAFSWPHPRHIDKERYSSDYSGAPTTRVEFRLEEIAGGTRLTVTESGFEKLSPEHRADALPRNSDGWRIQMQNIERHVAARS